MMKVHQSPLGETMPEHFLCFLLIIWTIHLVYHNYLVSMANNRSCDLFLFGCTEMRQYYMVLCGRLDIVDTIIKIA